MQASGVHLVLDRAPFDDESLTGLLIRIAGVNLLQSVGSLERLADIAVPRLALEDGGCTCSPHPCSSGDVSCVARSISAG